ncbi:DNA mismatch repair endonuclease MutL [Verrucomicrobiota bacterium]
MSTAPRKTIQLLSDVVINKIAAGEVVERPASVLKEMLENSVDAGSTRIEVELVDGGRKLIAISDNGIGMDRDNALLSVERHATSKIRDVDDIEQIATLGFRGEALAAISSVSRFTLTTRPHDEDIGTEISISGGRMQDVRDAGCPAGTRIEVRNLFFNVPARRKFLRTDKTELAHARQLFLVHALAHPDVSMRLVVDEREVYNLPAGEGLGDRICELYNREFFESLCPVEFGLNGIEITGFAGLPAASRKDRSEQHVFINGRPAAAPVIYHAINQAYNTLLPKGRHPVLFLFVEMEPELVDVNVHPTKKEVRFRRPSELRDCVIEGVQLALQPRSRGADIPAVEPVVPVQQFSEPIQSKLQSSQLEMTGMPKARSVVFPKAVSHAQAAPAPQSQASAPVAVQAEEPGSCVQEESWSHAKIMGQVGGLFVVMEADDGLILMDPHAAHERVLYEKFMRAVEQNNVKTQGLLTPETFDLQPADADIVRRNLNLLIEMGFGVSEFGGDTFMVDAMPTYLKKGRVQDILAEVARELEAGGRRGGTQNWAKEKVAQASCKAAVKANDALSLCEIQQLVKDLARAEMPYTCPHGRPTVIFMGYQELRRKFGRE